MTTLEIKKIRRSFCVVAGVAVLGKFRTEEAAKKSVIENAKLYKYWAQSAGVSIQNTPAVVITL